MPRIMRIVGTQEDNEPLFVIPDAIQMGKFLSASAQLACGATVQNRPVQMIHRSQNGDTLALIPNDRVLVAGDTKQVTFAANGEGGEVAASIVIPVGELIVKGGDQLKMSGAKTDEDTWSTAIISLLIDPIV